MKQDTDSYFLFHVVLEVLAITIRQENTKKRGHNDKESSQTIPVFLWLDSLLKTPC